MSRWYCLSRKAIGLRSDGAVFCASIAAGISAAMKSGWMRMIVMWEKGSTRKITRKGVVRTVFA
jgi:hypothetical protein